MTSLTPIRTSSRPTSTAVFPADHGDALVGETELLRLAQLDFLDEGQRFEDARQIFAGQIRALVGPHADAEEDGLMLEEQFLDRDVFADLDAETHPDAEGRDPLGFLEDRVDALLVGRDTVGDEAARQRPLLINRHFVAEAGELLRAGEPRRSRTDHTDAHAVVGRRLGATPRSESAEGGVGGVALEAADLDRPTPLLRHHARPLAKLQGRAHARARSAEGVRGEDGLGGFQRSPVTDFADEAWDVDDAGTCGNARRGSQSAPALKATLRFDRRLLRR